MQLAIIMLRKVAIAAASTTTCVALVWKGKSLVAASPTPKFELCQVQVVFRHGARTPLHVPPYIPAVSYDESLLNHPSKTLVNYELEPLDGTKKLSPSPFEASYLKTGALKGGSLPGQLTHIGANQTYQLGVYLRKRYLEEQGYLDPRNLANEICTRSTNVKRTVLSARSVLAGILSGQFTKDPLTIYVSSADDEIMYPNYYTCANLKHLARWAWDDPDKIPGISSIKASLQKLLNFPADAKVDLVSLRDNFAVEATHKKPSLKGQLSSDEVTKLEEGAMLIMKSAFIGVEEVRDRSLKLAIGPFIDILTQNMENVCDGGDSLPPKLLLYSGHDTTIIPLLAVLGIEFSTWPPYASHIILELYRKMDVHGREGDEAKYFVKVFYNGEQQRIGTCGADEACPLDEFRKLIEPARVSFQEYRRLCLLSD